ncbi:MAG: hypothetical protein ABI282_05950 [Candidatus Baltobacteraceae bacterium]
MTRLLATLALALGIVAAAPVQLDSQIVLERYELEMTDLATPKATIVSYTVSQAGPTDIETHHRMYRAGLDVRDETISIDGSLLKHKVVRFSRHEDRYTSARLAPRGTNYGFVFLRAIKRGGHLDYEYEATPLVVSPGGFTVKRVTIDGERFLPRSIAFTTASGSAQGTGEIDFAPSGKYWVPVQINVDAQVKGKPARERISWSDYRFPPGLPPSTFQAPKPLPQAT